MDPAQILLIIVITILTTLLTVVGIQAFFVLKELRRSAEKLNKILDNINFVSEAVASPISSLSSSLGEFSGIIKLLGLLLGKKRKEKEDERE